MAFEAFLKIPGVDGEADDKGFEGQIELLGFSLGATNPTSVAAGGGSGVSKAEFTGFNIMKKTDLASGPLFQACASGKHFNEATVTLRKSAGDSAPLNYLVYKFNEVYVNNVQWSGGMGGDDVPQESAVFSFAKMTFTYTTQTETGSGGKTSGGGWDLRKNAPAQ